MDEELQPGVDRPRRGQYLIAALVIVILGVIAWMIKAGALS